MSEHVIAERAQRVDAITAPRDGGLPPDAAAFLGLVGAAAVAAATPFLPRLSVASAEWPTFALLAACAAFAQLFVVRTGRNHSYHTTPVFLLPAVLLLPPELLVLLVVVQHVPDWLKERYAWYIQTFNICCYTLALLAASGSAELVLGGTSAGDVGAWRFAAAGVAATVAFVAVNHVLLAQMLRVARGRTLRESRLFAREALATDLALGALGVGVAALWHVNPWLIPLAVSPLVLIHRSLYVPRLEAEARIDAKTSLFNARHFNVVLADEIARAARFQRPLSLVMADLDLLRDINNTYGHLAGDAVLKGVAETCRAQLRDYDVPARFGGEEFVILLPETPRTDAAQIAERIRAAVAEMAIEIPTSVDPVRVTVSIGVASFPDDAADASNLLHQADVAVYRAKLQGRNRVLTAVTEPLLRPLPSTGRLAAVPERAPAGAAQLEVAEPQGKRHDAAARPGRRHLRSPRVAVLAAVTAAIGLTVGAAGLLVHATAEHVLGIVAMVAVVGLGHVLAPDVDDSTLSVGAIGALAGAALFGPAAALPVALTSVLVEWSARRDPVHRVGFKVAAMALGSAAAAGIFGVGLSTGAGALSTTATGVVAGAVYVAVSAAVLALGAAAEGGRVRLRSYPERLARCLPQYAAYGLIGSVIALAYHVGGVYSLAVFALPLVLVRRAQAAYLSHIERNAQKLREAAETIQAQNFSLEEANRLLKERSTAAMESLSATVDARDAYTAGHSRRVQRLALAIGAELGLSRAELDLLGHAALFHDIGKVAIPDQVLLKPAGLSEQEWALMKRHADDGARIIGRLGFLTDAVPAIRHHHERFDGSGYPDGLRGEEIPLGARIIHVADAFDSMRTTRTYRPARPVDDVLAELRRSAGAQFCPRCVDALERVVDADRPVRASAAVGRLPSAATARLL